MILKDYSTMKKIQIEISEKSFWKNKDTPPTKKVLYTFCIPILGDAFSRDLMPVKQIVQEIKYLLKRVKLS